MSYTKLLSLLIQSKLVIPASIEPLKPPYPHWYDRNAHCEFHLVAQGHSTEDCKALKYHVQALIEGGYLNLQKSWRMRSINWNQFP